MKNDDLNLKIESSSFENNYALNGGALYLNSVMSSNKNGSLEITNTQFINNKVEYFGGGIFSDFSNIKFFTLNNITLSSNKAYAGGAIYINNTNYEELFDVNSDSIKYVDNKSESHGNDYASSPYIVILNSKSNNIEMMSGLPLRAMIEFDLYDKYNQIINDKLRIYPYINMDARIDSQNSYKITGNTCTFTEGNFNNKINNYFIC